VAPFFSPLLYKSVVLVLLLRLFLHSYFTTSIHLSHGIPRTNVRGLYIVFQDYFLLYSFTLSVVAQFFSLTLRQHDYYNTDRCLYLFRMRSPQTYKHSAPYTHQHDREDGCRRGCGRAHGALCTYGAEGTGKRSAGRANDDRRGSRTITIGRRDVPPRIFRAGCGVGARTGHVQD